MSHAEALQIISRELQSWGYSVKHMPRYLTLEQMLRIVGAE